MTVSIDENTRPLAIFDLDGTLVRGDSLIPFLFGYGRRRRRWTIPGLAWPLLLYTCRLISAQSAKQRLLRFFLGGEGWETIEKEAMSFCESWVDSSLNPLTFSKLQEHQAADHRIILLSASPDVYVSVIGKHLGIREVVCTKVECKEGVCTGAIRGNNCKGEEKLRMLQDYLGQIVAPAESFAYGDSCTDLPVLKWVTKGFLVQCDRLQSLS
jgi:HAD superfamily hydrolase (TIGR01490 family)